MSEPTFAFDGLAPWRPDPGLIECEVGTWLVDLHSFAAFFGYTFRADGILRLSAEEGRTRRPRLRRG